MLSWMGAVVGVQSECGSEVCRFPALQDRISAVVRVFIGAAEERAKTMLVSLFECETAYINTDHPDYIGMQRAWKEHMASKDGVDVSGSDEVISPDSRSHSPQRRQVVALASARNHVHLPLYLGLPTENVLLHMQVC
jgi:Dynamin central region